MKETTVTLKSNLKIKDRIKQEYLKSFIDCFVHLDSTQNPEIIAPNNGFKVHVYIEKDADGNFVSDTLPIYFWPKIFQNYAGIRPVSKVFFSNFTTNAPGIFPLFNGEPIANGATLVFEEKLILDEFLNTVKVSVIDHLFTLNVDPKNYKGETSLFSMNVMIKDLLGNVSNKVFIDFTLYNPMP